MANEPWTYLTRPVDADRLPRDVRLDRGESSYLDRELHLEAGTAVRAFDGNGRQFQGELRPFRRGLLGTRGEIRLTSPGPEPVPPEREIHVYRRMPWRGTWDVLVEPFARLGVGAFHPLAPFGGWAAPFPFFGDLGANTCRARETASRVARSTGRTPMRIGELMKLEDAVEHRSTFDLGILASPKPEERNSRETLRERVRSLVHSRAGQDRRLRIAFLAVPGGEYDHAGHARAVEHGWIPLHLARDLPVRDCHITTALAIVDFLLSQRESTRPR